MDHVDRILAQWRQDRPDLDTGPMGIFGRLKRLQQALAEGMALEFEGYGLNAASFDVLATLRRAGPPVSVCHSETSMPRCSSVFRCRYRPPLLTCMPAASIRWRIIRVSS